MFKVQDNDQKQRYHYVTLKEKITPGRTPPLSLIS